MKTTCEILNNITLLLIIITISTFSSLAQSDKNILITSDKPEWSDMPDLLERAKVEIIRDPLSEAGHLSVPLFEHGKLPIIDMHMHIGAPLDLPAGAPAPCLPHPCDRKGQATANSTENLEKTLEAMDRYNIVKGFLSDHDPELVRKWVAAAPDRFIPSPFIIEPGEQDPEEIRKELEAGRFLGIGEIGSQLIGIAPNDPALEPYFALAEEFDVPVLIHTEGIGPPLPSFRSAAGSPLLLEEVMVKHPKLRIFVENTGYPYLDEMIAMMYQYPQLYGDLSTITWIIPRSAFYDYLERLIKAGLGKRLMFGSDQMRWLEMIGKAIEAIEEADFLTEEQKRDILYNNAARFLQLNTNNELSNE